MAACCCSPCRPAYKRHVDAIYPAAAEDGLVKNKMESLVYFAMTSPEKLDRIGEYLAYRISRDVNRSRKEFVFIGVDAMDQLLKSACHVRILNLFVESFLKTIQKLLQSTDPDLQILASKSFLHFSKIEEETPSYHRTYNDFIAKFSEMCHKKEDGNCSAACTQQIRISGLQGLLGVIRKTVNEDLAENIWEPEHMDKIIPSLLYNLEAQNNDKQLDDVDRGRYTPDLGAHLDGNAHTLTANQQADQILRELVQSASYASINAIITPVLMYIDQHNRWTSEWQTATINTFNAIMYSIQVDLSYILIERILVHLDKKVTSINAKGNVATVLSKIIGIGVGESTVGPAVLEIINALLRHLQLSVRGSLSFEEQSSVEMQTFQNALLRSLGEYTGKMPDFQKSENMTFILSKIPND